MNALIVLCAILSGVIAAPSGAKYYNVPVLPEPAAPLLTFSPAKAYKAQHFYVKPVLTEVVHTGPIVTGHLASSQDTYGQYNFAYSSSDGQAKNENRQADGGVSGQFSYMSPEGKHITLSYIADRDGFRPSGNHLPVAPAVPDMPAELAQAYKESNDRLAQAYEEARLRGDTEFSDDGSYKEELKVPVVYKAYAAPVIHTTYTVPTKSIYAVPAPIPVAPAPVKHSATSYSTEIGGTPVLTVAAEPAPLPVVPAKSAYTFTAPVKHSSTSYSAEIGGTPTLTVAAEPAPLPAVHKKSGYTFTGGF